MDILELTKNDRDELLKYLDGVLSFKAMKWARETMQKINDGVKRGDSKYIANVITFYRNIRTLLEDNISDTEECNVIFTFYLCALQLGVRKINDEVESFESFEMLVDKDDWKDSTPEIITRFDMYCYQQLTKQLLGEEHNLACGGLITLSILSNV